MPPIRSADKGRRDWVHSAVTIVEFQNCIKNGQFVELSAQQLVDCSNYGCNIGWSSLALVYIANQGSIDTAAYYPSTGSSTPVYYYILKFNL
jgi:hypothetical protein